MEYAICLTKKTDILLMVEHSASLKTWTKLIAEITI